MKIEELDNLVILTLDKKTLADFIPILQEELSKGKAKTKNIIINLLSITDLEKSDLEKFQKLSAAHIKAKHSFVLVNNSIHHSEFPEDLQLTPTLKEAKDLIEMEEIERDLGF